MVKQPDRQIITLSSSLGRAVGDATQPYLATGQRAAGPRYGHSTGAHNIASLSHWTFPAPNERSATLREIPE